ncbi:MAG: CopG family transcriptional regulator [Campylobacterales bacterium]|nr:CopG family transcriptional regulator [Campylobacterales bacterium]
MSAEEFDRKFDNGEDILPYIDLSSKMTKSEFEKKLLSIKKVNVDLPSWAIASLDKEAKRMGVTRQSIIKMWLIQKLDDLNLSRKSLKQVG